MLIDRNKIEEEIKKHEEKAKVAYWNYQSTGYKRYETMYQKYEDWAETLSAYLNAENAIRINRTLTAAIKNWVSEINRLEYQEGELKQDNINNIFGEIKAMKGLIKLM